MCVQTIALYNYVVVYPCKFRSWKETTMWENQVLNLKKKLKIRKKMDIPCFSHRGFNCVSLTVTNAKRMHAVQ